MKYIYKLVLLLLLSFNVGFSYLNAQTWQTPIQAGGNYITNQFNSVYFTSSTQGWAVGNGGIILTTSNGGITWTQQTSGIVTNLTAVYFTSSTQGWVAGSGGTILTTSNGGITWTPQLLSTSPNTINGIFFTSSMQGWAVGSNGTMLTTSNGGATWTAQTVGTSSSLLGIYFTSSTQGWAVGSDGTILTTINGGTTWTAQTSGTTGTLNSVYFTSALRGWAVGNNGTIVTTSNGGTTWTIQTSGTISPLNSVHFISATQGWAVGSRGTILTTINGGTTWTGRTSGTTSTLRSVYFTTSTQGWAVGFSGRILTTSDGGITWTLQTSGSVDILNSVHFTNSTHGWAVGNNGTILTTSNGGTIWRQPPSNNTIIQFNGVYFTSSTQGWAVGDNGRIQTTSDGGTTWIVQSSSTIGQTYADVFFTSSTQGWVVGNRGLIQTTSNGGTTWPIQTSGITTNLNSVYFTSATQGWAVGNAGVILTTSNGGTTWTAQTSGTTITLNDVYFTSATQGWAVGASGIILTTSNGGVTWTTQISGTSNTLNDVYFTSATQGWAVGASGIILTTSNGGVTWIQQTSGTTSAINGVYFTSATRGIAVGSTGTILVYGASSSSINNADLSAMTISSGTLAPVFATGTIGYAANVPNTTSSITVTPTRSAANATIQVRVNGGPYETVVSGTASGSLALNVGTNTIDVLVTAQDGTTTKMYTTTVTSAAAIPTITSATYNNETGVFAVTGVNLSAFTGANNDIDVTKLSITGDGPRYTLTSANVEITNSTNFSITLNSADRLALATRLNKNGTSSQIGNIYNLEAAANWLATSVGNADLTGNSITVSKIATINATGTLTALNTNTGNASTNTSFTISGEEMNTGIVVTPPAGFEVSNSATGPFTATLTVGAAGNIASTTIFVRLAAATAAGTYSGNIVLSSAGSSSVNMPTVSSTVTAVPLITSNNNFTAFTACFGKVSTAQLFTVRGQFLTADLVVTAPSGFEISRGTNTGVNTGSYSNSITLTRTANSVTNTILFIRLNSSAASTNIGGNIACTTTGGSTLNIPMVAIVSVSPAAPSITATGSLSVCSGATVSLTSTLSSNSNTLAWFRNGTSINTTTTGYTASLAGSYTSVETSANGCASAPSAAAVVIVNAAPEAIITQGSQLAFNNCATTSLNLNANTGAGLTYQWRLNGTDILNASSSSYAVTQAGNYTVRIANANNCSVVSTATNVLSTPSATATGATNVCTGSAVALSANATGFINPTYQWLRDGAVIDNAISTGFGATQTGSYSVRITSGSIITTSCPVTVTVNTLPIVSIAPSPSNSVCIGTPLTINSTAATAMSYQWFNGTNPIANATAISYAVAESGTFSVRVTDANGCINTSAASTVVVNELPVVESISGASQVNIGSNITLFNTTNGGVWTTNNSSIATINTGTGLINGVSAGNVQVKYTVQNASGCSAFVTTNIAVNALGSKPSINTTTPTAFCAGGSVNLSSSASTLNQWYKDGVAIGGANAATYTATQTGVYTVGTGVETILSNGIQVSANALPTATITQGAQLAFTDCETTSINLSANTIAGATYQWINANGNIANATNQLYAVTTAGNYSVRVTDANGCIGTSSISRVAALPTATVTGNTVVCAGTPVSLSINQSAFDSPSFQWKNGGVDVINQTGSNFNPTVSGTYTVSVTDNAIVSTSCPINITVNALPTGSIAASTSAAVCAGTTVTLTATPNNASAYQWLNGGNAIANATNNNFIADATGTYSVRITDANGCFNTIGATNVTVNPLPVVGAISGEQTICANTNTNYTNQTTGGVWSSSNTTVATIDQFGSVRGVSAGIATITYTVTNNSCSTPVTRNITVTAAVAITTQPTAIINQCVGTNATISVAATGTNLTYQWFKNGTAIDGATTNTYTDNGLISTDAGSYTVVVSSTCGNITSSTSVWTVNAPPEANISNGFGVALGASGSVTLSANTGAGLQYRWLLGGNTIANQTAATLNVTQAGSYTVLVTSAAGCVSAISSPTVVTTLPTAIAGGATTFCEGGNVNISVTLASGQTFVRWKDANGQTVGTNSTTFNATTTGAYASEINTGGSNVQTTQAVQVTVNALPTPNITSNVNPAEVCASNTVLLTGAGGVSYQWLQDNSAINNATNATFTASASGSYQLRATDINGCRATTAITTVTINPLPTASITASGNTSFCAGGSVLLTSASTIGNQWFKDGVIINGAIDNTFTSTTSGSYTVTVSSVAGCSVTSTATIVTVNAIPTATITNGSSLVLGNASSINLTANTGAGLTYTWFLNGTVINGQTNATLNVVQTGSYTVQVTNASGCSALSTPTLVSALPTLTTGGSTSFCPGGSVVITATIGTGQTFVRWKDANGVTVGTNATSYTATTSGAYAAEINTGTSIETTQSVTVTVFALPTITINSSVTPAAVCAGSTILLTANGGTSYQWLQDGNVLNSATASTYTANLTGAYSVRNTDANGCIATATATNVTINPRPVVAAITGTPQVCVGLTTTFSNTISGGEWRTANAGIATISTTGVITGISAGTVTISYIVTNASGCIRGVVRNVTVNALPTIASITGTQQFCVGLTTAFVSTTTGGIWSSSNTAVATISATGIITGVSAGTSIISYTVTNASGCITTVTRDVTVNALPTVAAITGTQQVCVGLTTSFASTTTGGVWSSSNTAIASVNTSGVVSGVSAGTATIRYTVTNASGCITIVTRDITVNTFLTVAPITGLQQLCFQSTTPFTSTTPGGVWSSGNTTAATIDANGVITGRQAGTATISYAVTNAVGGCVTTVTRDITVNALPLITASANPTQVQKGQTTQLNVSAFGNIANFVWSPTGGTVTTNPATTTVRVNQNTTYTVTATSTAGCIATANVAVTTKDEVFVETVNVFSPNGDGINDKFVIKNLDLYPNNKLQVFDRTGKIMYEQNNYANTWDGTVNGKLLTKDTYFYVLIVNGQVVKKATITLVR